MQIEVGGAWLQLVVALGMELGSFIFADRDHSITHLRLELLVEGT